MERQKRGKKREGENKRREGWRERSMEREAKEERGRSISNSWEVASNNRK